MHSTCRRWLVSRTTSTRIRKQHWCESSCLLRPRPLLQAHSQRRRNSSSPWLALAKSPDQGIFRLLNDDERDLLRIQRQLTQQAWSVAAKVGVSTTNYVGWGSFLSNDQRDHHQDHQQQQQQQPSSIGNSIDSTFCVVVAGEYNAGKSTLINALLGQKLLATGSLPTTDGLIVITHDEDAASRPDPALTLGDDAASSSTGIPPNDTSLVQVLRSRQPLLQDLTIVDTPGTNAVLTNHTALTVRILPAADLILFVTSADRPFPESERTLLESMATHFRKHVVMVINKMDVLDRTGGPHGQAEKQRVVDYVTEHARSLLGARPVVLAVSARDAWAARQSDPLDATRHSSHDTSTSTTATATATAPSHVSLWRRSNFATLEQFLHESLSTRTKIKAKLNSPVGLTLGLLEECHTTLVQEQDVLAADVSTLSLVQHQLDTWRSELALTLERAVQDMCDVLEQEGSRGHVLLARISLWDFYASTWDAHQLLSEWNHTKPIVWTPPMSSPTNTSRAADAASHTTRTVPAILMDLVRNTADTVATRGRTQGQRIIEFLGQRPAMRPNSLVGSVTAVASFADTQRSLNDTLGAVVQRHVTVDVESTASTSLLQSLQQMAWLSMLLNGASVGSFAVAAAAMGGVTPLDIGLGVSLSCGATFGLSSALVLHMGRRHVASSYQAVWSHRSDRLRDDATTLCRKEAERMERRIRDGVAPYTRWVDSEQTRLKELMDQCGNVTLSAQQLQKRIANL